MNAILVVIALVLGDNGLQYQFYYRAVSSFAICEAEREQLTQYKGKETLLSMCIITPMRDDVKI